MFGRFPVKRRLYPGLLLLICVCTLFLNVLISVAAAAVILFLPQDFSRIFIKEAVLGAVSAVVLTADAVLADRRSRKVLVPLLCVHVLFLAASFFILSRCGYYPVWKFMLFCLVIPQISAAFFSLMNVFPRKKICYIILFAGLICLLFAKTIFFMNG